MSSLTEILAEFIDNADKFQINKFGSGLIHHTYLVSLDKQPLYVLQALNYQVFKDPQAIASNISTLQSHINQFHPNEIFPGFISTKSGESYHFEEDQPYRLSPFIKNSHSIDFCSNSEQAFEAAYQFGKFTSMFDGLQMSELKLTIPQFHDLSFRWDQFLDALNNGNKVRIEFSKMEIELVLQHKNIVEKYTQMVSERSLKSRVTHHDTKISNVLFDPKDKGICVIDLDTTMPGYFISDLGDMFRTYLSEATEEETDLEKIVARKSFYHAIIEGYTQAMSSFLLEKEYSSLNYAGEFMIYMQAIRFLTDFINDDRYYGAKYELHNYNRAKNQLKLLQEFHRISS